MLSAVCLMVFILALFPRTPVNPPRLHTASTLPSKQLHLPPSPAIPVLQSKHADPSATPRTTPQLKQDEQASLWKAFSEARREVTALNKHEASLPFNKGVRLFAQNPGQKLTARFLDHGVRIQSGRSNASWQATFSTTNLPPATSITTQGSRVEYLRGPVIEWYDNKPEGIEQGFIVTQPLNQAGELRLEVNVNGLTVSSSDHTTIQLLSSSGGSNHSNHPLLSYSKLSAWDTDGKLLPAHMESTSNGITLIVSSTGASYPITIDPLITTLEQKLGPEPVATGDYFGMSLALSDDTALIGVPFDNTASGTDAGSAYIFSRSGSTWYQQAKLTSADAAAGDIFGSSVSLSNNTALISAPYDNTPAGTYTGSAYVFTRSGTIWSQQSKFMSADATTGDFFGSSVAISGDTALIGAFRDDTAAGTDSGSAYVFTRSGTTWSQQAKLTAGDGVSYSDFGTSVSLSGNTALIGAYYTGSYFFAEDVVGSAYVFTRSGNTWSQQAKLTAGDGALYNSFGLSVALDADTALVSAYQDDTPAGTSTGSAYIFTRSGTTWSQQAKLMATDAVSGNKFGFSVALSDNTALVSAPHNSTAAGTSAGSAYVFSRSGSTWSQQTKLTADDGSADDNFGQSVALYGDTAIVSAALDDTTSGDISGSAYVFHITHFTTLDSDGDLISDIWENTQGFNPNATGDVQTLDTDHDGVKDILEIFQGTDRNSSGSSYGLQNRSTLADITAGKLKTRYRHSTTQSAVKGTFKWSTDLANWYAPGLEINGVSVNISESNIENGSGYEVLEATASVTLGSPGRLFLKLELIPVE